MAPPPLVASDFGVITDHSRPQIDLAQSHVRFKDIAVCGAFYNGARKRVQIDRWSSCLLMNHLRSLRRHDERWRLNRQRRTTGRLSAFNLSGDVEGGTQQHVSLVFDV